MSSPKQPLNTSRSNKTRSFSSLAALSVAFAFCTTSICVAQNGPTGALQSSLNKSHSNAGWSLAGKWTYRSYNNEPSVIVGNDAAKALKLIFGEGTITLTMPSQREIRGILDMGDGYILDLSGTSNRQGTETTIRLIGLGRTGTPTQAWEYDYEGVLTLK